MRSECVRKRNSYLLLEKPEEENNLFAEMSFEDYDFDVNNSDKDSVDIEMEQKLTDEEIEFKLQFFFIKTY